MKKLILMLAALLAIALPKVAQADFFDFCCDSEGVEGFYLTGDAGLNFLHYKHKHTTIDFKPGWLVGAHAGYRWCMGVRTEAELTYRYNRSKTFKEEGFPKVHIGGHLRTWSFMGNILYDIPLCWCITPYIGAGIGYDSTKIKACKNGSENGFAWQIIAGGLYPIDECMEMGLEYVFHKGKEKGLNNNSVDVRFNFFF